MCSPIWTIGHLSACPNCACWQWLGLAVGPVLSETVERPGFHSTSCFPSLQWKSSVMWPAGFPPAATRNLQEVWWGQKGAFTPPHGIDRKDSGGILICVVVTGIRQSTSRWVDDLCSARRKSSESYGILCGTNRFFTSVHFADSKVRVDGHFP